MRTLLVVFLLVAVLSVAYAGVHHYRIDGQGNHVPADAPESTETIYETRGHHEGSIFDTAASFLNGIL